VDKVAYKFGLIRYQIFKKLPKKQLIKGKNSPNLVTLDVMNAVEVEVRCVTNPPSSLERCFRILV
jgi:hypothetical protein